VRATREEYDGEEEWNEREEEGLGDSIRLNPELHLVSASTDVHNVRKVPIMRGKA